MVLSDDLVSEFTSVLCTTEEKPKETTCYGKVIVSTNETTGVTTRKVQLDGSNVTTPATFTVPVKHNDRVMVILKNRQAIVIANITNPELIVGTLKANDKIVVLGSLTTNEYRSTYNDTVHDGLTFDSNGIGACDTTTGLSWWLKKDGTFQFGGENGIGYANSKVTLGSGVTLLANSIKGTKSFGDWSLNFGTGELTIGEINVNKIQGIIGDSSDNGGSYINFSDSSMHIRKLDANVISSGYISVDRIQGNSIPNSKLSGTASGTAFSGARAWGIDFSTGVITIGEISASSIKTGTLTVGGAANNTSYAGSIVIKNASDQTIGSWNNTGITAEYGTIAGWKIEPTALSKEVTISETVNGSTVSAKYKPYIQALANPTASNTAIGVTRTVGSSTTWPFVVYYDGSLTATKANITGVLTAGANSKIGPWNVTNAALWYGAASSVTGANAYQNANGLYFGTSGLSLKDKFYVTAAGVPHCNGADLFINSPIASGNSSGLHIQVNGTTFGIIRVDGVGTTSQSFNVVGFNGNASSPVYHTLYLGGDDIVLNAESSVTINPGYPVYVHNSTFVGASKTSPYTQPGIGLYTNGNLTLTYDGGGAGIYFAYNKASSYTVGLYESASGTITCTGKLGANGGFVGALTGNVTGNCSGSSGSCTGQINNVEGNSYYGIVTSSTDKQRIATIRCSTDTTGRIIVRGQFNSTTYSTRYFDTSPTSSDIRLKTNIEYSSVLALPIVNAIKIRSFDWKEDMRHQRIGMIADELEILDPMFTVGGGCEEDGSINVKAVNSFYLQGYIVKAIQELSDENQKLKEEISKLKGAA